MLGEGRDKCAAPSVGHGGDQVASGIVELMGRKGRMLDGRKQVAAGHVAVLPVVDAVVHGRRHTDEGSGGVSDIHSNCQNRSRAL